MDAELRYNFTPKYGLDNSLFLQAVEQMTEIYADYTDWSSPGIDDTAGL